jgi:hypothetical protein
MGAIVRLRIANRGRVLPHDAGLNFPPLMSRAGSVHAADHAGPPHHFLRAAIRASPPAQDKGLLAAERLEQLGERGISLLAVLAHEDKQDGAVFARQ